MTQTSAYQVANNLKSALEEKNLISDEFKRKVYDNEGKHENSPTDFDSHAAQMLWLLVHKFLQDNVKSNETSKMKRKNLEVNDLADFNVENNEEGYNVFISKIKRIANDASVKYTLLNELWNYRTGLLVNLVIEKIDVKKTFATLNSLLAEELNVDSDSIDEWLMNVEETFIRTPELENSGTIIETLGKLLATDPLREQIAYLKKDLIAQETETALFK